MKSLTAGWPKLQFNNISNRQDYPSSGYVVLGYEEGYELKEHAWQGRATILIKCMHLLDRARESENIQ